MVIVFWKIDIKIWDKILTFSGYCNDDGLTLWERQRGRKKKDRERKKMGNTDEKRK